MSVSGFTDDGFPIVSSYGGEYIMTNFNYASNGWSGDTWTYFDVVG